MDDNRVSIHKTLLLLILVSTGMRILMASMLELSVDEVYYWLYALYPDWSHFDHPPLVGFTIQLFSLNLLIDNELFIRMGPIVFSVINTLLLFKIGQHLRNDRAGLYMAFLYNSSIYLSVLSGTFIIPDSPQMLFWIAAIYFMLHSLPAENITRKVRINLILSGLAIGLATLSKYHGIFIGFGVLLYVVFQDRRWLREPSLYVCGLLAAICLVPILVWNLEHDFVSFGFHSTRVHPQFRVRLDYFATEILGQIAYNNPVNYVLIMVAIINMIRGKFKLEKRTLALLLYNGIPLWLVFTSFSVFRSTLPHWTGPAFIPMIILAGVYLAGKPVGKKRLMPISVKAAAYLVLVLAFVAIYIINYLPAGLGKKDQVRDYGTGDFTQDMYGWDQLSEGFLKIRNKDLSEGNMSEDSPVITFRYFPAAHFDYYFANDHSMKVYVAGDLPRAHNYYWINRKRGPIPKGSDVYTIVVSNWYSDPNEDFGPYFERIEKPEVIEINRAGVPVRYALIYRLRHYRGNHPFLEYGQ